MSAEDAREVLEAVIHREMSAVRLGVRTAPVAARLALAAVDRYTAAVLGPVIDEAERAKRQAGRRAVLAGEAA